MQTKTRTINEAFEKYLELEDCLLEKGLSELLESIEPIKPSFYLNRLLAKLNSGSSFTSDLQCYEIIKMNGSNVSLSECLEYNKKNTDKDKIEYCDRIIFETEVRKYKKGSKKASDDIIISFEIPFSNLDIGKEYFIESSLDIISDDLDDNKNMIDDKVFEIVTTKFIPQKSSEKIVVKHIIKPDWIVERITNFECAVSLHYKDETGEYKHIVVKNGFDYSIQSIKKRNELIRDAMQANIPQDITKKDLYPLIPFERIEDMDASVYKSIENSLLRNNNSSIDNTGFTRYKLFLLAFVLNLDFDTIKDLMVHCVGEEDFNYKNPYEVLFVYCTIIPESTCERFIELKKIYEQTIIDCEINRNEMKTRVAEKVFQKINGDDDLIDFLCTLPCTERKSAKNVLDEIFNKDFKKKLEGNSYKYDLYEYIAYEIFGFDKVYNKEKINGLGKRFLRDGVEIKELLDGTRKITKNDIVIFLFFKYVFYKKLRLNDNCYRTDFEQLLYNYQKYRNMPNPKLKYIWREFTTHVNDKLEEAGFSVLYLPNTLEKMIGYSLLNEYPLEAFQDFFDVQI